MKAARALFLLGFAAALSAAPAEKPKTFIQGRRMDVLKKGEAVEFTGGVTMTRGLDFMSADRMVNREKEGLTRAWGHVYLRRRDPDRGMFWESWGDEGLYDSNASSGTLWGRVYVDVRESGETDRRTYVWADRAEYDGAARTLRFTGAYPASGSRAAAMPPWPDGAHPRPRVVQEQEDGKFRDLAGETVTYFQDGGRLDARGDVWTAWRDDVVAR